MKTRRASATAPCSLILLSIFCCYSALSQTSALDIKNSYGQSLLLVKENGKVRMGLGTDTSASLSLFGDNGFVAQGTLWAGTALSLGSGTRLLWYPQKAAFRAGYVSSSQWDDANIGDYSTAVGYGTTASAIGSVSLGYESTASGAWSAAIGCYSTASGSSSTALGYMSVARSSGTTVIGFNGRANHPGSIVIAANSSNTESDSVSTGIMEQIVLRADAGMYITNGSGQAPSEPAKLINTSTGAYLSAGGTWTDASSRRYKENIADLSLEDALETLTELNPVTFNYKVDKEEKHVGFIAEAVPDLVSTKDRKGLSPMDIVAVLTRVVQSQRSEIELLKQEIQLLKDRDATQGK